MKIKAIDNKNDLFSIKNIITEELLEKLSLEVLDTIPYTKMEGLQAQMPRRKLVPVTGSTLSQIQEHIDKQKDVISKAVGYKINQIDSVFWLDQPGFSIDAHIDNPGVGNAMQIYLSNCKDLGTIFYNVEDSEIVTKEDKQRWHYQGSHPPANIRKAFDFETNTGYIMINNNKQLHGVPNTVGKDDIRLSAYCYLNYED